MIDIQPVSFLKNKIFNIPAYQRGYRWEKTQVYDLLNDLWNFSRNEKAKYYCLQPVVVARSSDEQLFLIDGQQRLTTLRLLSRFVYLKTMKSYYDKLPDGLQEEKYIFKYVEGRRKQDDYLNTCEFESDKSEYANNIETFYIKKAWDAIDQWFLETKRFQFINTLWGLLKLGENENASDDKYIAVIWQEIPLKEAAKSFQRLNYGKINLVSSEIIKSLLLQTDCYPDRAIRRDEAARRGNEWDRMELALSNPHMAGMLGLNYEKGSLKIGVLLNFVIDSLNKELGYPIRLLSNSPASRDRFNYDVIIHYLNRPGISRAESVQQIWDRLQNIFNVIMNWYQNRTCYHLIGLYSLIKGESGENLLTTIYNILQKHDKPSFVRALKNKIAKIISIPPDDSDNKEEKLYPLNKPCYGVNNKLIINILITFNVWMMEKYDNNKHLFPFHLLRQIKSLSLEHIIPQSIDAITDNISYEQCLELLKGIKTMSISDSKRKHISNIMRDEETYLDRGGFQGVKKIIKSIESDYYALQEINQEKLHRLENLALLDTATNSALANYNLCEKRERLEEKIHNGVWITPETVNVYIKKHSALHPLCKEANSLHNMAHWLKADRDAYLEKIFEIYNDFMPQ